VHARGAGLEVLSEETSFWNRIREATGNSKLESVSAYAFHPLALSGEFTPLLGVDFQKVVIAQRTLGKGNIFVSQRHSFYFALEHAALFGIIGDDCATNGGGGVFFQAGGGNITGGG